jgi:hypothetical protein
LGPSLIAISAATCFADSGLHALSRLHWCVTGAQSDEPSPLGSGPELGRNISHRQHLSRGAPKPTTFAWTAFRERSIVAPVLGLLASATAWRVGIALGIVVILVAAAIVIAIVLLAQRIARQAKTAEDAVEVVRRQTDELAGIERINDSGVRILHSARALRKVAVGK